MIMNSDRVIREISMRLRKGLKLALALVGVLGTMTLGYGAALLVLRNGQQSAPNVAQSAGSSASNATDSSPRALAIPFGTRRTPRRLRRVPSGQRGPPLAQRTKERPRRLLRSSLRQEHQPRLMRRQLVRPNQVSKQRHPWLRIRNLATQA